MRGPFVVDWTVACAASHGGPGLSISISSYMGLARDFGREWYLTYLTTVTVPHMSTDHPFCMKAFLHVSGLSY